MNRKAVTKPGVWGEGWDGWTFPRVILFLPLTKAGWWGDWDLVSGSPSTISREGSGRQGATSDSKEATQHALVRQGLSLKEASARKTG